MELDVEHRLSAAAFWYSAIPAIVLSLVAVACGGFIKDLVASTCATQDCPAIVPLLTPLTVLVFVVGVLAYPVLDFILFSFSLGTQSISINSGILFRQYETIRFDRIQTLDLDRGPILWLFGLTAVNIWTANPDQLESEERRHARADTKLLLPAADAEALRDQIMRLKSGSVVQ